MKLRKGCIVILRKSILAILLLTELNAEGQESTEKNGDWDVMFATGFSYGIQSISIPPFMQKISIGVSHTSKLVSLYLIPGITIGIAPMSSTHIEGGLKYHFLTFDYTANWTGISGVSQTFVDQSLNLGLQIKLNPNGNDDLWLWAKGGKSFFERGFNEEYQPTWDGYNVELKLVWKVASLYDFLHPDFHDLRIH